MGVRNKAETKEILKKSGVYDLIKEREKKKKIRRKEFVKKKKSDSKLLKEEAKKAMSDVSYLAEKVKSVKKKKGVKYFIHIGTTNTSALKLSKRLKKMGVKNNKFFLALYDKKLADVNPFSDKLGDETKLRIHNEIRINPWYYYREIFRIPEPGGNTRFIFDIGNISQLYIQHANLNQIKEQPRHIWAV